MYIGILSDTHQEFDEYVLEKHDDVFYINAGDTHPNEELRNAFNAQCDFSVLGNHDFYRSFFKNIGSSCIEINGIKIAGATLWTDLISPAQWRYFKKYMMDYEEISGITFEKYLYAHRDQKDFLFNSGADIWVTHHSPLKDSIHPKHQGHPANIFFSSDYAAEILALPKPPKLIIHGHTHEEFDYMVGDTRVICHPRGYPREQPWFERYQPKIIEV